MVETYGLDQERIYYILEANKGTTPNNPAMLGIPHETLDVGMDVGNIPLRAGGNFDVVALKKGMRNPTLKVTYPLPSAAPIELLQYAKRDLDKTLSVQVLYYKGAFATATDILSFLYTYMRINKATVSCDIDDVVKATLEMVGQQMATGTAKIAGATYTDHTGAVAFNESAVTIAGATDDRVVGWKFDIVNNARQVPVIRTGASSALAKYVPFGQRSLSGEITFEFESKAEMDAMLADTAQTLTFGLGGAVLATFTGAKWSNVHHERLLDDLIAVRAEFDATGLTIA
jgi:hypothetical protein